MSIAFRTLNEHEKSTILSAAKKGRLSATDNRVSYLDALEVSYEQMQGGFCVCLIKLDLYSPVGEESPIPHLPDLLKGVRHRHVITVWRGASRRSYKDPRKPIRGEMLAFSRAILYSRGVEV